MAEAGPKAIGGLRTAVGLSCGALLLAALGVPLLVAEMGRLEAELGRGVREQRALADAAWRDLMSIAGRLGKPRPRLRRQLDEISAVESALCGSEEPLRNEAEEVLTCQRGLCPNVGFACTTAPAPFYTVCCPFNVEREVPAADPPKGQCSCDPTNDCPAGTPGPPGPPGGDGEDGDKGDRGKDAPNAFDLFDESSDPNCLPCPAGPPGINGRTGRRGDNGPRGQDGVPSEEDYAGIEGPPGLPGEPGLSGQPGGLGPRGSEGAEGYRALPGPPGPLGPPGPVGGIGEPGRRGRPGPPSEFHGGPGGPGPLGYPGADGRDGGVGNIGGSGGNGNDAQYCSCPPRGNGVALDPFGSLPNAPPRRYTDYALKKN